MQKPTKLLLKFAGLTGLVLALGIYANSLYSHLRSTNARIALLQQQLSDSARVRADNEAFQQLLARAQQLEDLRKDNAEVFQLQEEIKRLQAAAEKRKRDSNHSLEQQISQLQTENLQLRNENQQLEQAPETVSAREAVDLNELAQMGQAIGLYAKMNDNKMPQAITELKDYTSADVFPTFDTNRFELIYHGKLTDITDPAKTALIRSRFKDNQNQRPCLFADGHAATEQE